MRLPPRLRPLLAASFIGLGLLDVVRFMRHAFDGGSTAAVAANWIGLALGLGLLSIGIAYGIGWWRERTLRRVSAGPTAER